MHADRIYNHVDGLRVSGWRRFENVEIAFHPNLTILTGANGAGKSTLLTILSPMFGWKVPFASVPAPLRGLAILATNVWNSLANAALQKTDDRTKSGVATIGAIEFGEDQILIQVPDQAHEHTYSVTFDREARAAGLFIPAHRPVFTNANSRATTVAATFEASESPDRFTRGDRTIVGIGLNRSALVEKRQSELAECYKLVRLYKSAAVEGFKDYALRLIEERRAGDAEYSFFTTDFFKRAGF